jgi:hypothetical protein
VRIGRLERAHDHLAGVHPNANFYWHSSRLEKSVAATANLLLHAKRSMKRTLWMVFVRYGSPEQGEDAVTRILHVAIVTARHIDHYFQRRVDNRVGLLRVEVSL